MKVHLPSASYWFLVGFTLAIQAALSCAHASETLKIVTINVWSGLDYLGYFKMGEYEDRALRALRTEVLIAQLNELAPDIVGLNEANKLPRYARHVARELGFDAIWHVGVGGLRAGPVGLPVNLREGDAILARPQLGLQRAGRKQLSGGPVGNFFTAHFSDATQVVAGKIQIARQSIYLFCTHWHASAFLSNGYAAEIQRRVASGQLASKKADRWLKDARAGQDRRLREARKMLAFIQRVAGDSPVILMGDFNALPDSDEIGLLRKAGFVDAFAAVGTGLGYTWDENRNANIKLQNQGRADRVPDLPPSKRIDYIFVRGSGLKLNRAQVVLDRSTHGLYPSDHFGVFVEITVGPM
jgi:hypothetical protein